MSDDKPSGPHVRPDAEPAIKVLMMPRDTNVHGTIFGGLLLSHVDQAGAVHARQAGCGRVVTIAMDAVEFKLPVYVGDVVSFYCRTLRIGRTSLTVQVDVWATRHADQCENLRVTEAKVTYVNVDENRRPIPVPRPESA